MVVLSECRHFRARAMLSATGGLHWRSGVSGFGSERGGPRLARGLTLARNLITDRLDEVEQRIRECGILLRR